MVFNYLKIAFRNLWKQKGYSFINITGLAIGLACCFLIAIYINYELSYDRFHNDEEQLYRTIVTQQRGGTSSTFALTPSAYAAEWVEEFPGLEYAVCYSNWGELLLQHQNEALPRRRLAYADSSFLKAFSFDLAVGDLKKALSAPMSIIIPAEVAKTHFPGKNPVGETILMQGRYEFTVTGVFENLPSNTHFSFAYLASLNSIPVTQGELYSMVPDLLNSRSLWNFNTYLKLKKETNAVELEHQINEYESRGRSQQANVQISIALQPVSDIHFTEGIEFDTASGNLQYVWIFSGITILILLIAGFNFVNLSTARAIKRAKEVGLRKVMGADRRFLVLQFLGEALIYVTLAFVLSLFILEAMLPLFKNYISNDLSFSFAEQPLLLLLIAAVTLLFGLLAGSYPAFYLSSYQPVQALKHRVTGRDTVLFRKVLTISQFVMASFLLIGTIIVYSQMRYMKNADPGFQKDQIAYFGLFDLPTEQLTQFDSFRQQLLQSASVEGVSRSDQLPGFVNSPYTISYIKEGNRQQREINALIVDSHFLDLLGIELVEGRNLSEDISTDLYLGYLLNEAAVRAMDLEEPIGTEIRINDGRPPDYGKVVGVIEDFNYAGLQQEIQPLVLRMSDGFDFTTSVKLAAGQIENGVQHIEQTWSEFFPGYPVSVNFLDDTFDRLYQSETNLSTLMSYFSGLAIFVACLGLIGLASFMAAQRTKEIGIRKSLGAGVANILGLLNKDFLSVVFLGFAISVPIAWLAVKQWLQDFAYRIEINAFYFLLPGLTLIFIAVLTVSWQSWKAAKVNPVKSLRSE